VEQIEWKYDFLEKFGNNFEINDRERGESYD
jgi:hypothetical protein